MEASANAPPSNRAERLYEYPTPNLFDLRRSLAGLSDDLEKEGHSDVAQQCRTGVFDINRELQRRRDAGENVRDPLDLYLYGSGV